MIEWFWGANLEIVYRLLVAIGLGSLLGVERSLARKTAGMRTYALVTMGSALFIIVADQISQNYLGLGLAGLDPLRVASQIIVGIGFLGAGIIIFKDEKVSGLTTAAGLWVAAGIGMALGYGFYFLSFAATVLTLLTFTVLWRVEQFIARQLKTDDQRGTH